MRSFLTAVICSVTLMSAGCYTAPVIPGTGFIYTNTEAPLDHDLMDTKLGSKTGTSSATTFLGLVSTGDASAAAAARAGNITTIRHADYQFTSVLGVYQKFTTVVYGD
jgi:hypothetical protein